MIKKLENARNGWKSFETKTDPPLRFIWHFSFRCISIGYCQAIY